MIRTTLILCLFCALSHAALRDLLVPVAPPEPVEPPAADRVLADANPRQVLHENDIRTALIEELLAHYNLTGDLRIAFLRDWRGARVPAEDWALKLVEAPGDGLRQHTVIRFAIRGGDELVGTWTMPLRCELWQNVLFTVRRMGREEPLTRDALVTQKIDMLRLPEAPVAADTVLDHYEIARAVGADRPLLWRDVVERPLVRKNTLVEVIAAEHTFLITLQARALENGRLGDLISIRNVDTKRDFKARVVQENQVRVYF